MIIREATIDSPKNKIMPKSNPDSTVITNPVLPEYDVSKGTWVPVPLMSIKTVAGPVSENCIV